MNPQFLFRGELQANEWPSETLSGWDLCSTWWWATDTNRENWATRLATGHLKGPLAASCHHRAHTSLESTARTTTILRARIFRNWLACESSVSGMELLTTLIKWGCRRLLSLTVRVGGNDTYWLSVFFNQSLTRKTKAPSLSQPLEERSAGPVAAPKLCELQNCLLWDTPPPCTSSAKWSFWLA